MLIVSLHWDHPKIFSTEFRGFSYFDGPIELFSGRYVSLAAKHCCSRRHLLFKSTPCKMFQCTHLQLLCNPEICNSTRHGIWVWPWRPCNSSSRPEHVLHTRELTVSSYSCIMIVARSTWWGWKRKAIEGLVMCVANGNMQSKRLDRELHTRVSANNITPRCGRIKCQKDSVWG